MAKQGSWGTPYGPEPVLPLSAGTLDKNLKQLINESHCIRWSKCNSCEFLSGAIL